MATYLTNYKGSTKICIQGSCRRQARFSRQGPIGTFFKPQQQTSVHLSSASSGAGSTAQAKALPSEAAGGQ
ncbi:MAG: hypothetical protein WKF68_13680 [Daejeonella sp.]